MTLLKPGLKAWKLSSHQSPAKYQISLWSDAGQSPSVCNIMCRLKPHGMIACRTFAYFVQGSWWKGRPWLVPPPLSTQQRRGKIQNLHNQLSTVKDHQSIIIIMVGSCSVLMSKLQTWLTRGLSYLGLVDAIARRMAVSPPWQHASPVMIR